MQAASRHGGRRSCAATVPAGRRAAAVLLCSVLALAVSACTGKPEAPGSYNTLYTTTSRIKTLDPAVAEDVASCLAVGHLYDRLVQYDYEARPYAIVPSMAAAMPQVSADGLTYEFRLRDDLVFSPDPCLAPGLGRQVRARDVVFSLLRVADPRWRSPGYWTLRGYVRGLDAFREACAALPDGDLAPYDAGVDGLSAPDDRTVVVRLTQPYPRLLHVLAMTYGSVAPEAAVRHYGARLAEHPVGSGAFRLEEWQRSYRFVLCRNPDYRRELAGSAAGATLPRLDRVVCHTVQEPLTAWLLFLQGNLDLIDLTGDSSEAALVGGDALHPDLAARGVEWLRIPAFQINYVAFNAQDPRLGRNRLLRQAISLAYDVGARVAVSNGQLTAASGPIPPGVSGYDPGLRNPFATANLAEAKARLAEAGYPDGIDPQTGRPLQLRFDLGGTDLIRRQQAEMMVADTRRLGLEVEPCLNSWPKFLEKLQTGDAQMFRVGWVGDYPDGQNFLQLFYGPNAGGCNRARYRNPAFDTIYEQAVNLPDSPVRDGLYQRLQQIVIDDCAWIFESYPVSHRLVQPWVRRYIPHHFAYECWKYVEVDGSLRNERKRGFRPVRFSPVAEPAPPPARP